MKEFDAYLFDFDGTLIDTKELIYQSFRHMADGMGDVLPDRDTVLGTIGLPVRTQIKLLMGADRDEAYYDQALRLYTGYMNEVYKDYLRLFPGVREGLRKLADMGKMLAIVTSRRRPTLDVFLDFFNIAGFFPVIVTPDDTPAHKPDPAPVFLALDRLGIAAGEAVFVGDAEYDILAGHRAAVATAFVTWGGNDLESLTEQPDFIIDNFGDLLPDTKE